MNEEDAPPTSPFGRAQAASYDKAFEGMAPLRDALLLVVRSVLSSLPARARILCVGAGTGLEIAALAAPFPEWRFTAVDPSGPMLEVCRRRLEESGLASRCDVHEGYLESLPASEPHDAATALLVSQFVLDLERRRAFFREIARRLRPGGLLVTADLARARDSDGLVQVWSQILAHAGGFSPEQVEANRDAHRRAVAVLAPVDIEALIASAGFEPPLQVYQGGLIHGWSTRRSAQD